MKKILLYNWVQFDNEEKMGGGVTVYCNNIVDYFSKEDNQIVFLSSGRKYDKNNPEVRIEKSRNKYEDRNVESYEIINSPIMSPGQLQFHNIEICSQDMQLYELLKNFIKEHDGFDVLHFNNLEGLSSRVFMVKEDYPEMRIVFSMHNYYPFCPQVNLWFEERMNCPNYKEGSNCMDCVGWVDQDYEKEIMQFYYDYDKEEVQKEKEKYIHNRRVKRKLLKLLQGKGLHPKVPTWLVQPKEFANFRETNVEMINRYVDSVLAVSNRVGELCISFGIMPEKVHTSYIGTKFAGDQRKPHELVKKDVYNIIYLGYQRRDKGFFFLLKALMCMDEELAKRIKITFATKTKDPWVMNEFERLEKRGMKVVHLDGYNHRQLDKILKQQDLGIVPVLWEDNFPQVAIEFAAFGVPVLASDLGGANELSKSNYFVFENGNVVSFIAKLQAIMDNPELTKDYWNKYKGLPTMEEHLEELKNYYFM